MDVTQILHRIEHGEPQAANELLPLVYDELRKLAAQKLAHERPGQTLQATALVHEAYLRLVSASPQAGGNAWDGRGHFFAAAAESMRRILVENARHKQRLKHGGGQVRVELTANDVCRGDDPHELLALHEALQKLADADEAAERVAKLRLFAGLSVDEAGAALGISRATAYRNWTYAKAWLTDALRENAGGSDL